MDRMVYLVNFLSAPKIQERKTIVFFLSCAATEYCGVLLATDLAARGVDIPGIDWIVQFDMPQDPSQFVHRIGRTARAGRDGQSLSFLLPNEECYSAFLQKRQISLQEMTPSIEAEVGM